MIRAVKGIVTDATDPARPLVRLDQDSTAAPTANWASGYSTPVNGDRVMVLIPADGGRFIVGVHHASA